jgi:DNA-binding response OmpR family regulator
MIVSYLEREEFAVQVTYGRDEALRAARDNDPDVVVLHLARRNIDGLETCRQLRTFSNAYVVMLTARDAKLDTTVGLADGADDYIVEPFSPRELVARIRAIMRRQRNRSPSATGEDSSRTVGAPRRLLGSLQIDIAGRQTYLKKRPIALTRIEFDLLAALSSRPGAVFTRRQLLQAVWGQSSVGNTDVVDVHIGHLRRKLGEDPRQPRYVMTVRGVGYRMGCRP